MDEMHRSLVAGLQIQVRDFYKHKVPFRVYHGSTNATRSVSFQKDSYIDTSQLNRVLAVDPQNQTALVEPNVAMDELVKVTLQYGLVPPVVPEFPGITVGGALQGGAGESSSYKWGFVSQNVNWIDYLLADGTVTRVSSDKQRDLFYGAAGSMGTLGVITATELRLIPAAKYVQLTYLSVDNFKTALTVAKNCMAQDYDFVDGILFAKNRGVVIAGKLSNEKLGRLQRFSRPYDQWYYLHAQKIADGHEPITETVPLPDYLFRYDRGAFWTGFYAFQRFGIPFNRLSRFMLDPILHTRKLYQALQESGASQQHIIQDLSVPYEAAENLLRYIDDHLGIYPLWLCPIKPEPRSPLLCNGIAAPLVMNIGVWGSQIADYARFKQLNRAIESEVAELGGKKWLYAHTYYTEREFWRIYDKRWYDKLRRKYRADYLPGIYDKVVVRERYRLNARRAVRKTIAGTAKLPIT